MKWEPFTIMLQYNYHEFTPYLPAEIEPCDQLATAASRYVHALSQRLRMERSQVLAVTSPRQRRTNGEGITRLNGLETGPGDYKSMTNGKKNGLQFSLPQIRYPVVEELRMRRMNTLVTRSTNSYSGFHRHYTQTSAKFQILLKRLKFHECASQF